MAVLAGHFKICLQARLGNETRLSPGSPDLLNMRKFWLPLAVVMVCTMSWVWAWPPGRCAPEHGSTSCLPLTHSSMRTAGGQFSTDGAALLAMFRSAPGSVVSLLVLAGGLVLASVDVLDRPSEALCHLSESGVRFRNRRSQLPAGESPDPRLDCVMS